LAAHRELSERGLTRLERLLALERAAKNLEGMAGATAAAIARVRSQIAEFEIQILQVDARRIEEAEEKARDTRARENQVIEQLASMRDRLGRMEVRAPVAGTVFGMTVFAPREVVRPGEPILQIVPEGASLVVMARLNPIHVDQVYPDQAAVLRFSAFPARVTPELDGHVRRVSADALRDLETGKSWYEVELAPGTPSEGAATEEGGDGSGRQGPVHALALTPGMPVEVHIRTAERTLLSYLAKPVTDFFRRGLREE
jgi:HlyD family secretion protein